MQNCDQILNRMKMDAYWEFFKSLSVNKIQTVSAAENSVK